MTRCTPPSSSPRPTRTETPPPPPAALRSGATATTTATTAPTATTPVTAPTDSRAGSAGQATQTATALRQGVEGRVATTSSTPSSPVLALPDLARGATGGPVRVLQDHLVKAGLMTQAEVDTGPGIFGPRTARALSQLQGAQGLPVTGRLDGGTRRALAGLSNGVANGGTNGGTNGAPATSSPPAGMAPGARVTSAAQATAFHVTQWGEPGQDAFNSGGTRFGFNDCGPASGVIALSALGLVPHPGAQGAMGAIDRVRDAALGRDTTQSERMGFDTLKRGVEAQGATTSYVVPSAAGGRDLSGINAALARGNPVIVGGDPKTAWSQDLARRGDYLDNDGQVGGHFVTVSGRASNGNYIVNDPLHARGAMEVTPAQLTGFLQQSFGPTAMEVARRDGRGIGAPTAPLVTPPTSTSPPTSPPAMGPGNAALAPQVIGAPRGDGSVNGALAWSADQMPGGTGKGVNSNNGQSTAASQNAWNSWCLAFVSTSYGRQVPELQAPDAISSSRKFESAGKLRASSTDIPAGAPVFFAATSHNGQFGHIALATGRTDPATGEPLIRSTGWNGKPGIFEAPLSYFSRTTGAYLGFGDVGPR